MKVHFLAPHPLFGRKSAPRPIEDQQQSPYYWWWEFLRRNEEYAACCAEGGTGEMTSLYADFGVVSHDTFKQWWGRNGYRLFSEKPKPVKLTELSSPSEWDPAFQAPLSTNDPGEKPSDGSLLIAKYGKGHYVYTGLSFFRELPAGVPGAFRLFANLISLGR